jgi:hypothetical protein
MTPPTGEPEIAVITGSHASPSTHTLGVAKVPEPLTPADVATTPVTRSVYVANVAPVLCFNEKVNDVPNGKCHL